MITQPIPNTKEILVKNLNLGDIICGQFSKAKVTKVNQSKDKDFLEVYVTGENMTDYPITYQKEQIVYITL